MTQEEGHVVRNVERSSYWGHEGEKGREKRHQR